MYCRLPRGRRIHPIAATKLSTRAEICLFWEQEPRLGNELTVTTLLACKYVLWPFYARSLSTNLTMTVNRLSRPRLTNKCSPVWLSTVVYRTRWSRTSKRRASGEISVDAEVWARPHSTALELLGCEQLSPDWHDSDRQAMRSWSYSTNNVVSNFSRRQTSLLGMTSIVFKWCSVHARH